MLFTSIQFWAIFIVFLLFFAAIRQHSKVGMMIYVALFSLGMYALSTQWLCLTLPLIAVFTWVSTRWMQSLQDGSRKGVMALIIIITLLPLLFFKYSVPISDLWNTIVKSNFAIRSIAMPVGISFFTFQLISYTIDVYKGKFTDKVSFVEFLFYATFFPVIFAGPITRAETFFSHFRTTGKYSGRLKAVPASLLYTGLWLIMLGLVKKLVIADYIAQFNNLVIEDPAAYTGIENILGVIGYSMQIYCDFSGYSDISIGMAALLGVNLPENFNLPYQSLNITEFWHRWHISLSTWFRDYIYIPLGGNRKGIIRQCLNILITMFVAGIWHGSTYMFMLWGVLHAIGLIIHKLFKRLLDYIPDNALTKPVSWLLTYFFICITWILFFSADIDTARSMISQILTTDTTYLIPLLFARPLWLFLVVGTMFMQCIRRDYHHSLIQWYVTTPLFIKIIMFAIVIQLCIQMNTSSVQPFIYYQF